MIPSSALFELSHGVMSSKYVTPLCCAPIYRRVRLAENGSYQDMYCDCGHCISCTDRKRNEMATRMFLHATSYKYCYFVTLTYGSYNLLPFKRHPFLNDWLQTIPTLDSHNSFGVDKWTPTILVKSHIQKFHKRLQKLIGSFTYCCCGEYGSTYGRPHFHSIIFSNNFISPDTFKLAWSLECKKTPDKYFIRPWRGDTPKTIENGYFRFRLGDVKVFDLFANGSLNYDGRHPGTGESSNYSNALHNFTYVAKYLGKNDPYTCYSNLPYWVSERIRNAYYYLSNDIDNLNKFIPSPSDDQLLLKKFIRINYDSKIYEKISIIDFKKLVSPFFLSSRRPAIGKLYFLENCARFQAKSFALPKFMGKSLTFPTYYFRLLSQKKYPLRLRKVTDSGVSLVKDLYPRLYTYFSLLRQDANFWFSVRGLSQIKNKCTISCDSIKNGIYYYSLTDNPNTGQVDHIDFIDPFSNVIHFVYNPYHEIFRGYIFNAHTKSYDLYEHYYDREEFCDLVLDFIENEYKDFPEKLSKMQTSFDLQNAILSDVEALKYKENYLNLRKELNLKYQSKKTFHL